jgi:hypothetical protein
MSVVKYPKVRDEWATLKKLQQGFSIARFGDGELKMATGSEYIREAANRHMARELMEVLTRPHPKCLVGIWPYNKKSPKYASMARHRERFKQVLSPDVEYYSSLISRPDSAPWIRTIEYALEFQKLWAGKRVALLCEPANGALRAIRGTATLDHVECPRHGAYEHIDRFERQLLRNDPGIVIMACGPTATCLANRLSRQGVQAIDFGSGGSFLAKLLDEHA